MILRKNKKAKTTMDCQEHNTEAAIFEEKHDITLIVNYRVIFSGHLTYMQRQKVMLYVIIRLAKA